VQSFAKHGVTDIAASIRDDGAVSFVCGIRLHWQFKDEACGVLARHSSRNYEEVRTSSSGVWEIALPGDALPTPGMNAGAARFLVEEWQIPLHLLPWLAPQCEPGSSSIALMTWLVRNELDFSCGALLRLTEVQK
jgi:hypothetical protein